MIRIKRTTTRGPGVWSIMAVAAAVLLSPYASAQVALRRQGEAEAPFNEIHSIVMKDGQIVGSSVTELPEGSITDSDASARLLLNKVAGSDTKEQSREKVHPSLKAEMERLGNGLQSDEIKQLLVTFSDDMELPIFPRLRPNEPRDSVFNRIVRARTAALIRVIQAHRTPTYNRLRRELGRDHSAQTTGTFWLINGMEVTMPLSAVPGLALRDDVLYIQPTAGGEEPPQTTNNRVSDGRARINSDPYFNLGLTGGYIGLLDTGVRSTHTLFVSPSNLGLLFDCVNGGQYCDQYSNAGYNAEDDLGNHGTASAAIISGNANLGNPYRGVTGITLDSYKVYGRYLNASGTPYAGLDTAAAVRGFEAAAYYSADVIVAEIQDTGNETSAISAAADRAFDAGKVVIAANGNNGPAAGTVNSPANAHKAIGVGAVDVVSLAQQSYQSRGPTTDGRIKPDIQAPTNTQTASNASDTALRVFTGTSGSTPYGAGAAALLRNWLAQNNATVDPGQVYAQLILAGQQPLFNNDTGVGLIQLPVGGQIWRGKVTVQNGQTVTIPLNVTGTTANNLDGAIWWPEGASDQHRDIDLYLDDPSAVRRASSTSTPSVFERARVSGTVNPGSWKLVITGYNLPAGVTQTVYWSAYARS